MSQEYLLKLLLSPHVSEKSTIAADKRKEFVFKVLADATKKNIKDAVELLFKVQVKSVRVLNVKTKPKRYGKIQGRSKAWKKAYVALKEGYDISFVGFETQMMKKSMPIKPMTE